MLQQLSGKKVVVIGASSGIGLAVCQQVVELGADVVMSSRSQDNIAPDGSITLTSSVSIFKPSKTGGISIMSAASGAVAAFGRSLALELAPVRVNVIAPGVVDTGVWSNMSKSQKADLAKWGQESLPVQHLGQPEELAYAVLSLMTNPYITGTILPVDGGLTLL